MQGIWLYLALYNSLSAGSCRQEILVALVGHISSPVQKEVDSGLCILSSLANAEHVASLQDIYQRCHPSVVSDASASDQQHYGSMSSSTSSSSSSLRVFLPFIKSLLEDVRMLKEHQQRSLFR
jgi:hypothetical protein